MRYLCLVYDKTSFLGSYVLAVASCDVAFCSNVNINFYKPIISRNMHSRCGLDFIYLNKFIIQIKLQAFATEQYCMYQFSKLLATL